MPRKSKTHKRKNKKNKTRKHKHLFMVTTSKKGKKNVKTLTSCLNCGSNCHCGPNCKCPHPCTGTCYLNNRLKKHKGGSGSGSGSGCGSCGCPIAPLSTSQMNKFGGSYPDEQPVIIAPPSKGYQSIVGIGQNGGSCSSCTQSPLQTGGGGNFYKPIGPIPGPIVGNAWGTNLKWPGMNDVGGDRNWLKPYDTNNDPQQQMSMNDAGYLTKNSMIGGYEYKNEKKSNIKKGGGLVPQDLVNLGRDFGYNFKTAYNALNGYKAPVDPSPYKGQLTGSLNKI